jgi:DNA polymerase elongation subunit (family B)
MSDKNPRYEETKQLETLYKFLSCSYYGVTGYVGFRLMNKWVRKAITFLGREALEECSKDAARAGYPRYYGDTDGLFFKLMTNDPGEGRIVESIVNKTLQRIALRRGASFQVEAKYEHFCKRIIFVPKITKRKGKIIAAKKNYAYTDEHDNLFVTGLAPRRSATAAATRELMMPWLETVLIKNDVPAATEAIRTAWRDLPNYPMNKIGMPRGIHKAQYGSYRIIKGKKVFKKTRNPWLDGMTYMKKRYGKMFREDKKPLLIWMRGTHVEKSTSKLVNQESGCNTDVICITENDTEIPVALKPFVDWERMRRLVLKNRFKPLFEAIGISWEEVIVRQKQTAFSHKSSKFKIKKSTVMERSLQKQTTLM